MMAEEQDILYWVWLAQACGYGNDSFIRLYKAGFSPASVYKADAESFRPLLGRRVRVIDALSDKSLSDAAKILDRCRELGIRVITYPDAEYPESLRAIPDPPPVLYAVGKLSLPSMIFPIAIVGTRSVSDYGMDMAFRVSTGLTKQGATIISGLALGVDGISHASALAVGGQTVAVVASGLDVVYPSGHKELFRRITENGAVISEYPPGTRSERYRFPQRNRLISGLGRAVVVIEGTVDSGALLTARNAVGQGKRLYTIPGRIGDENASGPLTLIREGARMLLSSDDLLSDFPDVRPRLIRLRTPVTSCAEVMAAYGVKTARNSDPEKPPRPIPEAPVSSGDPEKPHAPVRHTRHSADTPQVPTDPPARKEPDLSALSPDARTVYREIPADRPCLPDEIDVRLGTAAVMRIMTVLEMAGLIKRLPGGRICRSDLQN